MSLSQSLNNTVNNFNSCYSSPHYTMNNDSNTPTKENTKYNFDDINLEDVELSLDTEQKITSLQQQNTNDENELNKNANNHIKTNSPTKENFIFNSDSLESLPDIDESEFLEIEKNRTKDANQQIFQFDSMDSMDDIPDEIFEIKEESIRTSKNVDEECVQERTQLQKTQDIPNEQMKSESPNKTPQKINDIDDVSSVDLNDDEEVDLMFDEEEDSEINAQGNIEFHYTLWNGLILELYCHGKFLKDRKDALQMRREEHFENFSNSSQDFKGRPDPSMYIELGLEIPPRRGTSKTPQKSPELKNPTSPSLNNQSNSSPIQSDDGKVTFSPVKIHDTDFVTFLIQKNDEVVEKTSPASTLEKKIFEPSPPKDVNTDDIVPSKDEMNKNPSQNQPKNDAKQTIEIECSEIDNQIVTENALEEYLLIHFGDQAFQWGLRLYKDQHVHKLTSTIRKEDGIEIEEISAQVIPLGYHSIDTFCDVHLILTNGEITQSTCTCKYKQDCEHACCALFHYYNHKTDQSNSKSAKDKLDELLKEIEALKREKEKRLEIDEFDFDSIPSIHSEEINVNNESNVKNEEEIIEIRKLEEEAKEQRIKGEEVKELEQQEEERKEQERLKQLEERRKEQENIKEEERRRIEQLKMEELKKQEELKREEEMKQIEEQKRKEEEELKKAKKEQELKGQEKKQENELKQEEEKQSLDDQNKQNDEEMKSSKEEEEDLDEEDDVDKWLRHTMYKDHEENMDIEIPNPYLMPTPQPTQPTQSIQPTRPSQFRSPNNDIVVDMSANEEKKRKLDNEGGKKKRIKIDSFPYYIEYDEDDE